MIVLPIETKKRELKSKLLITYYLLLNKSEVLIGKDASLTNNFTLCNASILLKSAATFEHAMLATLKDNKNLVYTLDEEGIIPPISDPSINARFSSKNLALLESVFINGNMERKIITSAVSSHKLVDTGNPRLDLCKPKYSELFQSEINAIDKLSKGKKIILIASRFGDVNCHKDVDYFQLLRKAGYIYDNDTEVFYHQRYDHANSLFKFFLDLPDRIAVENPEWLVVIRPHPSEDHSLWREKANRDNVIVNSDYDITSWLHKGVTLIHNGCTTSVEAKFNGTSIITYKPIEEPLHDNIEADELGIICTTPEQVISELKNTSSQSKGNLSKIIYNDYESDSAFKIAKLLSDSEQTSTDNLISKLTIRPKIKYVYDLVMQLLFAKISYTDSKFPSLEFSEIELCLNAFNEANNTDIKFEITKLKRNLFKVKRL